MDQYHLRERKINHLHNDNDHAHVQTSLSNPIVSNSKYIDYQLTIGTWQQIIFIDFDTHQRTKTVICRIISEGN